MDREGRGGARRRLANVGIVVTLFLPAVYFVARPSLFSLLFALLFTAWVVYSIFFIYEAPKRQVGRAVGQLIAGIALLDSLVLVVSENYHGLLLALVAFGLTLFLQRYVKGT
jgi:4-hydroxybenzoate polyprenyltransferase